MHPAKVELLTGFVGQISVRRVIVSAVRRYLPDWTHYRFGGLQGMLQELLIRVIRGLYAHICDEVQLLGLHDDAVSLQR